MSKSADEQHRLKGRCLCGGVKYEVRGPLRSVVNCHCGQCRRTHGHYSAYTAAARDDLVLHDDRTLSWYESSAIARRGFCARCGASLFWDAHDQPTISIAAGTLDQPTGLETSAHIFVEDLPDYYKLDDNLEKWPHGLPG
ncbi:MAG: GFA family protein [Proteobacteria bacterium]|nr:MAG: GFA family protein [Pseudomonadota bacterium]